MPSDEVRLASVDLITDHSSFAQWRVGEGAPLSFHYAGHRLDFEPHPNIGSFPVQINLAESASGT